MKLNKEVFNRASTWANLGIAVLSPFLVQIPQLGLGENAVWYTLGCAIILGACQAVSKGGA